MIKKLNILPLILALLLAACAKNDYVDNPVVDDQAPISFSIAADRQTRAEQKADLENVARDFVVYGVNGKLDGTPAVWSHQNKVMENYVVWWNENSANTTNSNSTDWEYVGNYTGADGLTGEDAAKRSSLTEGEKAKIAKQSIKYWDYGQPYHIFWGFAKAGGRSFSFDETGKTVSASVVASEDNILYYTNPIVVEKNDYKTPVPMVFRCACSRIRFGFYEVIPGYAVKEVKFYKSDSDSDGNCFVKGEFVSEATQTFTYDLDVEHTFNAPTATITTTAPTTATSHTFGTLNYTFPQDNKLVGETEEDKKYLAKLSSAPTYAGSVENPGYYTYIMPYVVGNAKPLTIKCDYTLVSTDASGQEIVVHGATATVPSDYCQWLPNYSYTYIFKMTNDKLKPITFAAYGEIANTTDNQQGTITTVGEYSITTYQAGSTSETGIDYQTGEDIEVAVVWNEEAGKTTPTVITLNSADGTGDGALDYVVIYHQKSTKEWVVETATSDDTTPNGGVYKETIEKVEDGRAHFVPDLTGTYRIEYWHKNADGTTKKLSVKIVKIRGNEVPIEEYDKWQSGSSGTTTW